MKLALFTDKYFPEVNGVSKTLRRLTSYMERYSIDGSVPSI
ncbi:hypothetical protein [Guptibacillus algicola]|nr:hypothetical protein [Alkalihalobacillus algicola]